MQNWKDLYTEIADKLNDKIFELRHIDLWHNQVNFLETEHPFPTPAVFLNFRSLEAEDVGLKVQDLRVQVDAYVFYETFADTYHEGVNKDKALGFLDLLTHVYTQLHGTDGKNYSSMRRLAFSPVDTGDAGNLYRISFECLLRDYSAQKEWVDGEVKDVAVQNEAAPEDMDDDPLFVVP